MSNYGFLNLQSYSALPKYLKPDIEMSNEPNTAFDKGVWITMADGPFVAPPDSLAKFGSEDDYPKVKEFSFYGNGDCPLLPQNLIPNDKLGQVANFVQGPVLYRGSVADRLPPAKGERYVEIQRGTAIFTPNSTGRYDNNKTNNHVAIFLRYGNYGGDDGIFVIDQYAGKNPKKPGIRFIRRKTGAMGMVSNDARAFAVVFRLRRVKIIKVNIQLF